MTQFIPNNVHFIGIGGDGMSALAGLLLDAGKTISGSEQEDITRIKQIDLLREFQKRGAIINFGHHSNNIPINTTLVVRSSIIPPDNQEIVEATKRRIPVIKRSQLLGKLMDGKVGISIAGSAGKSSTSAMIGFSLSRLGFDPSICIGARSSYLNNRNYRFGKGDFFIAEADEFDRSFLDLKQETAVITNIFFGDHLDYYRDEDEMVDAFGNFIRSCNFIAVCQDSPLAIKIAKKNRVAFQTYGRGPSADWQVIINKQEPKGTTFTIKHKGLKFLGLIPIPGVHQVLNATASLVVLNHYGVDPQKTIEALALYPGINRRLEKRGDANGVYLYDDYGHNKIQIDAAIDGLRQIFPKNKIYAIFQPRQFRRTKILQDELCNSFNNVEAIGLLDISRGIGDTSEDINGIHSKDIVNKLNKQGKNAIYLSSFEEGSRWLKSVTHRDDVIITFGTGDPYKTTDLL